MDLSKPDGKGVAKIVSIEPSPSSTKLFMKALLMDMEQFMSHKPTARHTTAKIPEPWREKQT